VNSPGSASLCAKFQAARKQHLHDHRTAMSMHFEHVLAGERMRSGKIQQQPAVDDAAIGSPEVAERGNAGSGSPAAQWPRRNSPGLRPRRG
jgi:hypothetical protein